MKQEEENLINRCRRRWRSLRRRWGMMFAAIDFTSNLVVKLMSTVNARRFAEAVTKRRSLLASCLCWSARSTFARSCWSFGSFRWFALIYDTFPYSIGVGWRRSPHKVISASNEMGKQRFHFSHVVLIDEENRLYPIDQLTRRLEVFDRDFKLIHLVRLGSERGQTPAISRWTIGVSPLRIEEIIESKSSMMMTIISYRSVNVHWIEYSMRISGNDSPVTKATIGW